jgi:hypothetical protein
VLPTGAYSTGIGLGFTWSLGLMPPAPSSLKAAAVLLVREAKTDEILNGVGKCLIFRKKADERPDK